MLRLREQRAKWLRARYEKRTRRSVQDPPTEDHSLRSSEESAPDVPPGAPEPPPDDPGSYFKQLHAAAEAATECEHGYTSTRACPWCKTQTNGTGSAGGAAPRTESIQAFGSDGVARRGATVTRQSALG
jgi:hypothetical protein